MTFEVLLGLAIAFVVWAVTGHIAFLALRAIVRAIAGESRLVRNETASAALSCVRRLEREGRLDRETARALRTALAEERRESISRERSVHAAKSILVPRAVVAGAGAMEAEPDVPEKDTVPSPPIPVASLDEPRPLIERLVEARSSMIEGPGESSVQEPVQESERKPIVHVRSRPPMPEVEDRGLGFIPVLERFMDRRNIGWIDLLGGILILGGSIGLLTYFWSDIKEKPFLEIAVFGLVNAAISSLGIFTAARFRMPTTSRSLLVIGTLLMPLTHSSWATLGSTHRDFGLRALIVFGSVLLNALLYLGSRTLFGMERRRLVAGMLVPCALLTSTTFMEDFISRPMASTMIVIAALAFIFEVHAALERHRCEAVDSERRTSRLLLPIAFASAAFVPVFAVVFRRHAGYTLADDLSPVFAALAVAATAVSYRLGSIKSKHAEYGVAAFLLGAGSFAATLFCLLLAWPAPHLSLAATVVTVAGWRAISRAEGRSAPAIAAGILSLHAWLLAWHVALGHVELTTGRVLVTGETFTWFGRSTGLALALLTLAFTAMLASKRRDVSAHRRDVLMIGCAAIVSCLCILFDGYFVDGDLTSVLVLTILASSAVLADRILPAGRLAPIGSFLGAGAIHQLFVHSLSMPFDRALVREFVLIAMAFAYAVWNLVTRRRADAGRGGAPRFAQTEMSISLAVVGAMVAMGRYSFDTASVAALEAAAGVVLFLLIGVANRSRVAVTIAHGMAVVAAVLAATSFNHARGLAVDAIDGFDLTALDAHALALTAVLIVAILCAAVAVRRRKAGDAPAMDIATLIHEGAALHLPVLMTLPLLLVGSTAIQGLYHDIAGVPAGLTGRESSASLVLAVGVLGFVLYFIRGKWALPIIFLAGLCALGTLRGETSVLVLGLLASAAVLLDRTLPDRGLSPVVSILVTGAIYRLFDHTLQMPFEHPLVREVVLIALALAFAIWNLVTRRRADAGRGGAPRFAQTAMATVLAMTAGILATERYSFSTAHVAACEAAAGVVLCLLIASANRVRTAVTIAHVLAVVAAVLAATAFNHSHDLAIDTGRGLEPTALGTHILALTAILLIAVTGATIGLWRRKAGDAPMQDLAGLLHHGADRHLPALSSLPTALIGVAALQGLIFDVAGMPAGFIGWKATVSLSMIIGALAFVFMVLRRGWPLPFLFIAGLCSVGAVIDAFDFEARWIIFGFAILLPLYAFATTAVAVVGRLAADRRVPSTWFRGSALAVAALGALASSLVIGTHAPSVHADRIPAVLVRMMAALSLLPYATAQLLLGTHVKERRHFVFMFSIVAASAFGLLQAMVDPNDTLATGHRLAAFFVAASVVVASIRVLSSTIVDRRSLWESSRAILTPASSLLGLAILLLCGFEVSSLLRRPHDAPAMDGAWRLMVGFSLIGLIGGCLTLALKSTDVDASGRPTAARLTRVWLAEAILGALLLHVRYAKPEWFSGFFMNYWPIVTMGVAFLFLGATELAARRKLDVLERPFETTAALLAAFPAAATYFLSSRLDDSTVLFSVSGSFAALAFARRRVAFVVGLMITLNATWWSLLADSRHFSFDRHPQVAMIPIGLSLFAFAQIYGHRMGERVASKFRWTGLLAIYLSSTLDLFLNAARYGIEHSPWLPVCTALLSIAGTLVGIGTRMRSFVYCGCAFLVLSMVTIVWYASAALQWTWLWYVFGIATGATLIAAWAWIEHHRDRLVHLLTELRTWQT